MAFYSIILLLVIVVYENQMSYSNRNIKTENISFFFKGWTINTVLITIVQAGGGLLVAATLKYADAVLKTLATSGSIGGSICNIIHY